MKMSKSKLTIAGAVLTAALALPAWAASLSGPSVQIRTSHTAMRRPSRSSAASA